MGFYELPKDLKNIVCQFAYNTNYDAVENDLQTIEKIQGWKLSKIFLRHNVYSSHYMNTIPNPLVQFEPICNFSGRWRDVIDWGVVDEMLWRLDFRRKFVKTIRTRCQWRQMLNTNWEKIQLFDNFYIFLLVTNVPCFKPCWENVGFNQIKRFRGPFWMF